MGVTSAYIFNLRALYCALSVWRQVVKLCVKHSIKAADVLQRVLESSSESFSESSEDSQSENREIARAEAAEV